MITIVTHTRFKRLELLERCKKSVADALIPGATHVIIECQTDFAKARYAATQLDEFVAFVDDDDTISTDAIKLCYDAITFSGAGAATTNEAAVDINGKIIGVNSIRKSYGAVSINPRTIHHFTLLRASSVDRRALDIDAKHNAGVCWSLKASAALSAQGAIHVPIVGANWTVHNNSQHFLDNSNFSGKIRDIGRDIRAMWPHENGPIPMYDLQNSAK